MAGPNGISLIYNALYWLHVHPITLPYKLPLWYKVIIIRNSCIVLLHSTGVSNHPLLLLQVCKAQFEKVKQRVLQFLQPYNVHQRPMGISQSTHCLDDTCRAMFNGTYLQKNYMFVAPCKCCKVKLRNRQPTMPDTMRQTPFSFTISVPSSFTCITQQTGPVALDLNLKDKANVWMSCSRTQLSCIFTVK